MKKLEEVIKIKHGFAFKGEFFTETPNDCILVTPGNFSIGGGFKTNKYKYYNGPIPEEYILKEDDVIVTMTDLSKQADTLGYSAKVPRNINYKYLHNQRIGLISLIDKNYDINFIYWLMRTMEYQRFVAGSATGATVKHTSPSKIGAFKFHAPIDKKAQTRIASILSAYDDLIENNLKRIKLLEEIAQRTYEEWFVKFRINGEQLPIDEKTGLPVGWREGTIGEIVSFQNGFAYKSSKFVDKGFPIIKIKNIGNNTVNVIDCDFIDEEYAKDTSRFKLRTGDLLIAMTGATVGKVGYVAFTEKDCYLNQRVGRFINMQNRSAIHFIFSLFTQGNGLNQVINFAGGAAQPNISGDQILNVKTALPDEGTLKRYNNLFDDFINQILNLQNQNLKLKESRDILLPKLMNGTIKVSES